MSSFSFYHKLYFRWGLSHERCALKAYTLNISCKHKSFCLTKSGLHLSSKWPYLGATPDGLVSCDCCGKGTVEVKVRALTLHHLKE